MQPIDVHAHLFNLRYLPVAGIIRRYTNNWFGVSTSSGLQWFFWRFTASSFELDEDEANQENSSFQPTKEFSPDELKKMGEEELTTMLSNLVSAEDFSGTPLGEALDEFEEMEPSGIAPGLKFSDRKALAPLTPEEYSFAKLRFRRLLKRLTEIIEGGVDHIRWFVIMMNGEEYLLTQMIKDNNGVTNYLHHLMDVDRFFDDDKIDQEYDSYYEFYPTQVRRMQKLQQNHKGQLKGFVAFNPLRENCMQIIKDSLSLGFTGVKFYPPMGYKATGHEDPVVTQRIEDLITFCVDKDLPLFTHCNNSGFEARPREDSGHCSNPIFWEEVLQKHKTLRLCLGHGGGGEGWFTENRTDDHIHANDIQEDDIKDLSKDQLIWNQSYAAMVFKLCVEYPNVYCDFSYLDDMINRDGSLDEKKRVNFRKRLIKLLKSEPEFAGKFMYGSDWHMLYRTNKHGVYYNVYKKFFDDAEFDGYREGFFAGNALKYSSVKTSAIK